MLPSKDHDEIVNEIRRLLDRQRELLQTALNPDSIEEYGNTHKRIRELMDQLDSQTNPEH